MRIDFVITELFPGGAERCLTELALGLMERGDHVRLFSVGPLPSGDRRALVDRLQRAGVEITSAGAVTVRHYPRALRTLKQWLASSPPQVCQSFLFHANVLAAQALPRDGSVSLVGGVRVAERRRLRCLLERIAVTRMERVVCVSSGVARFARQALGCRPAQLAVIANGVDGDRFQAAPPVDWSLHGWPADAAVTLFAGRFHPQKGIELLQQQIDLIAPPGSNQRLLLVGDGPLRPPLQHWARQLGGDRVRLLPWQPEIAPLLRACRLLVLPSHYEGMPNVALEAMAAGRPVVCSDVEGSDELLSHAAAPQVFPAGDGPAMATLIQSLLADPSACEAIGAQNRARALREFSLPRMVDAYRSLYRELADFRHRG